MTAPSAFSPRRGTRGEERESLSPLRLVMTPSGRSAVSVPWAEQAAAAETFLRLDAEIRRIAPSPIAVLTGGERVEDSRHYPAGDLYDPVSHAQMYFHTHRRRENGHLHLFLRTAGMPAAVRRLGGRAAEVAVGEAGEPCHLVAIGVDGRGMPNHLFTTNRWVTGEVWFPAEAVIALLPRFRIGGEGAPALVGAWAAAFLVLVAPLVEGLVRQRDERMRAWSRRHPDSPVLDDPALEIPSHRPFALSRWLGTVREEHAAARKAAAPGLTSGSEDTRPRP
jgi:hypothetical protein